MLLYCNYNNNEDDGDVDGLNSSDKYTKISAVFVLIFIWCSNRVENNLMFRSFGKQFYWSIVLFGHKHTSENGKASKSKAHSEWIVTINAERVRNDAKSHNVLFQRR